jgi:hypothetical protein
MCKIVYLILIFRFNIKNLVNTIGEIILTHKKFIGDSPSNRIDCTTYRPMLRTRLVFLRNWCSQVFYLIRCIMPSLTTLRIVFLFFSFLCWEKCFLPNLSLISYISSSNSPFSSSKNRFYVTKLWYSKSALTTESNDISIRTFHHVWFFVKFSVTVVTDENSKQTEVIGTN